MQTKKSFCRFCHANCAIEVDIEDGRAVAIRGDTANALFGGYTCMKGRELPVTTLPPLVLSKAPFKPGYVGIFGDLFILAPRQ